MERRSGDGLHGQDVCRHSASHTVHQSTVWIFKEGMKYVGDGPMMTFARGYHACGIYHSSAHDGNPIIVISGGFESDTSEFWDFTVPGSKWILTSKSSAFIVSF